MLIPAHLREFQSLSPQQWLDRTSRTLPQALSVILVLAIAWQLVQLTWMLLDRPSDGSQIVIAPPSPAATVARKGVDVQAIVSAHLFDQAQPDAPKNPTEAPQTTVNLVLTGVIATLEPTIGWAIIGESAAATRQYATGAALRPGIKLHSVYKDRVIIDRAGQLETLPLPKQGAPLNVAARPSPAAARNNQFVENVRRIAETNPSAFAEIVRPQPVFANGVQRGYRVYPGRNRQQFAKLGLQPGDLVLAINGASLDDPQRGMEIFNSMGTSDRVNVTIERNGQSQELTLNTAQLSLPEAATEPARPTPAAPIPGVTNAEMPPAQPPAPPVE
jgi:general secretion pathway protein C